MENKIRCQSCGMPLGEGFFGSNADGSENKEYCKYCFQSGEYTRPNLTVDQMIQMSIDNMTQELKIPDDKAKELANSIIPTLKRWKK